MKRNPFQKQRSEPKGSTPNLTVAASIVRRMGKVKPKSLIRRQDGNDEGNVEEAKQER